MVIGEEHIALEMLDRGAGVVGEAGKAEVGSEPVEQRERERRSGRGDSDPVRQLVADVSELGRGKMQRQPSSALASST
jgi:hypothetical protein